MEGAEAVGAKDIGFAVSSSIQMHEYYQGRSEELVSEIMEVESSRMALDAAQARLLGKLMWDPTRVRVRVSYTTSKPGCCLLLLFTPYGSAVTTTTAPASTATCNNTCVASPPLPTF